MAEPFLGEIRFFSFNFPPKGWAWCNGQLLPINQNQALFALLGTTYGGNGQTTFALPDLRGRIPVGFSATRPLGQPGGQEAVTLTADQLPPHRHHLRPGGQADAASPAGARWADGVAPVYADTVDVAMAATTAEGGGQAHLNLPPYTVIGFGIALLGIFPSQN